MGIAERDEDFLHGLRKRQHWKEAEARRALSLLEVSGESRTVFARRYGLRASRFAWWERRLTKRPMEKSSAAEPALRGDFIELVPSSPGDEIAAKLRVGAVEIELRALDGAAARFVAELARLARVDACS
jgi:hypothetical protein